MLNRIKIITKMPKLKLKLDMILILLCSLKLLLKEIHFKPSLKEKHSLLGIYIEPLRLSPQGQTKGSDVEDCSNEELQSVLFKAFRKFWKQTKCTSVCMKVIMAERDIPQ